jgi:hypothetical protein
MSRATAKTALRNAVVLALLALAAASTVSQPREAFVASADSAQAMTLPPAPAHDVAQRR